MDFAFTKEFAEIMKHKPHNSKYLEAIGEEIEPFSIQVKMEKRIEVSLDAELEF